MTQEEIDNITDLLDAVKGKIEAENKNKQQKQKQTNGTTSDKSLLHSIGKHQQNEKATY